METLCSSVHSNIHLHTCNTVQNVRLSKGKQLGQITIIICQVLHDSKEQHTTSEAEKLKLRLVLKAV